MKRFAAILIVAAVLLMGCGKETPGNKETEDVKVAYSINNISVVPGTEFDLIKESFGEPVKYTEAASCYFDGMDKMFTYDGFEIRTYPKDGKDYIQDLCISSDRYKADGNVTVGSSLEDVQSVYGKDFKQTGNMYKYVKEDNRYIYFFVLNDTVKYFGYAVDASN